MIGVFIYELVLNSREQDSPISLKVIQERYRELDTSSKTIFFSL